MQQSTASPRTTTTASKRLPWTPVKSIARSGSSGWAGWPCAISLCMNGFPTGQRRTGITGCGEERRGKAESASSPRSSRLGSSPDPLEPDPAAGSPGLSHR
eukprot:762435-Hanusia_phi.AAC.4